MVQKRIRRTDQEWLDLIQECRTSGLTDKAWCEQQHIQRSNFYYQIRRLRKKACEIPDNPVSSCQEHHEVVAIDFSIPESFPEKNVLRDTAWNILRFGERIFSKKLLEFFPKSTCKKHL